MKQEDTKYINYKLNFIQHDIHYYKYNYYNIIIYYFIALTYIFTF